MIMRLRDHRETDSAKGIGPRRHPDLRSVVSKPFTTFIINKTFTTAVEIEDISRSGKHIRERATSPETPRETVRVNQKTADRSVTATMATKLAHKRVSRSSAVFAFFLDTDCLIHLGSLPRS
jgi:hypothetical protein